MLLKQQAQHALGNYLFLCALSLSQYMLGLWCSAFFSLSLWCHNWESQNLYTTQVATHKKGVQGSDAPAMSDIAADLRIRNEM